ncbi:30S ribosomal protein s11 chloroplastic [Phtheirospermum japonicum]|uniref:Selenoprotein O n=1 Tax=Phtheirospermum japonicum TaxID=374723 RepID=A0A830CNN8_9LAMI|nr:30S ribosomal protein s11 chloroplastic [Phtheirospermum japonicum]
MATGHISRHFSSVVSKDRTSSPVDSISEDLKNQNMEHNNGNYNNNYGRDGVNTGMNVDNICRIRVKLKLEELKWDHSFIRELPGDLRSDLTPREMYGVGWFPGPRPVLVDSRVREEGHPLLLKLQQQMLFVQSSIKVLHSCYTKVSPLAEVDNPQLVTWSDSVVGSLDLDPKE